MRRSFICFKDSQNRSTLCLARLSIIHCSVENTMVQISGVHGGPHSNRLIMGTRDVQPRVAQYGTTANRPFSSQMKHLHDNSCVCQRNDLSFAYNGSTSANDVGRHLFLAPRMQIRLKHPLTSDWASKHSEDISSLVWGLGSERSSGRANYSGDPGYLL